MQEVVSTPATGAITAKLYQAGLTVTAASGLENFTSYQSDSFLFGSGFGNDAITGFNAGSGINHDTLEISKTLAANYGQLDIVQTSGSAEILFNATQSITLKNVTAASLTSSDFTFS